MAGSSNLRFLDWILSVFDMLVRVGLLFGLLRGMNGAAFAPRDDVANRYYLCLACNSSLSLLFLSGFDLYLNSQFRFFVGKWRVRWLHPMLSCV